MPKGAGRPDTCRAIAAKRRRRRFLKLVSIGLSVAEAARRVGVTRQTGYNYMKSDNQRRIEERKRVWC